MHINFSHTEQPQTLDDKTEGFLEMKYLSFKKKKNLFRYLLRYLLFFDFRKTSFILLVWFVFSHGFKVLFGYLSEKKRKYVCP